MSFVHFDPALSPGEQPKFDVLVHKLTEDLVQQAQPPSKLSAVEAYLAANPDVPIVDPLAAVRNVVSREMTCLALDRIASSSPSSSSSSSSPSPRLQPRYFCYSRPSTPPPPPNPNTPSPSFESLMAQHSLSFPVICKPVIACGTPTSHQMVVVVSASGLQQLGPERYVVQQFHNHGGCFYKAYVIDQEVMVFVRPSLPNLSPSLDAVRTLEFDSRFAYPTLDDFSPATAAAAPSAAAAAADASKAGSAQPLPAEHRLHQRFRDLARSLGAEFGLSLFGFDVIAPSDGCSGGSSGGGGGGEEGALLVVDVNFFPSYKEVSDFPQRFVSYLHRVGSAARRRGGLPA